LEYLLRNAGKVVSKTMIIEHVWGYDFDPMTNIVDVLISRLRNKVDRNFDAKLIHTHRGVGYALRSRKSNRKKPRASSDGMYAASFLVITVALSIISYVYLFSAVRDNRKIISLGSNNSPRLRTIRASTPSVVQVTSNTPRAFAGGGDPRG